MEIRLERGGGGGGGGAYQKWKVPSEPAVEKVPYVGWNEIALTLKTLVMSLVFGGFSRWHLNEKFRLHSTSPVHVSNCHPSAVGG